MKGRRCSLNERKKQKVRPVSRSISTESDNSTGSFLVTSTSAAVEYKSEPETLKAEIFIETISSRQPNEDSDIANKTEKGRRRKPSLPLRFSTSLSQTETSKEPSLCKEFATKKNGGPSRYRRCRLCFPSLKPQVSPPMIGILTASSLISFYSWDNNVGHLTCRRDQTTGSYPEDFSKHDLESISYVQILKTQFEDEVCRYFQQLINVVDFYHSRGVYHRDLKPENLLLDAYGNIKVSDFGLSALSQQIRDYLAIESFKFEENHRRKSKLFSTLSIPEASTIPFAAAKTFNEVQDKCLNLQDENVAGAGQLKETDNCISVGVILQPKELFKESLEGRKVAASNNIKQLYYDMLTNDDDMSVSDLSQVNCERNVKMPLPTEEHISAPQDSLLFSSIADTNNGDSFPVIETLQLENIIPAAKQSLFLSLQTTEIEKQHRHEAGSGIFTTLAAKQPLFLPLQTTETEKQHCHEEGSSPSFRRLPFPSPF